MGVFFFEWPCLSCENNVTSIWGILSWEFDGLNSHYPKNHGMSDHWWFGDPRTLQKTESKNVKDLQKEGPMILTRADLGAQNTSRMKKNKRKLSSGYKMLETLVIPSEFERWKSSRTSVEDWGVQSPNVNAKYAGSVTILSVSVSQDPLRHWRCVFYQL